MANSRKAFSLQEKVKLIEACKTKSQAQVAKEFSVARGTLNGFIKDKIKIMEQIQISSTKSVNPNMENMENKCCKKLVRIINRPILKTILKSRAK